ncbi:hypothetical protein BH10CHL1_BH10CHL1_05840 [soil metagenome]
MTTNQEDRVTADKLTFHEYTFTLHTYDGGEYEILYAVSPRLLLATPDERATGKIMPGGYGIEWEALDEHLSVDGLIHGRISTETWRSIYEWYEMRRETVETNENQFGPVVISA